MIPLPGRMRNMSGGVSHTCRRRSAMNPSSRLAARHTTTFLTLKSPSTPERCTSRPCVPAKCWVEPPGTPNSKPLQQRSSAKHKPDFYTHCGTGAFLPTEPISKAGIVAMTGFLADSWRGSFSAVMRDGATCFRLQMCSLDMPGSRTWPFYLESYTAMAAIQAGNVADGLDVMRHIQLVHLRGGWTWSQNLWNPGELTYVAAPVTWFITDVLSNAALDASQQRLTLGPILLPGQKRTVLPLFFPTFWANLEYSPAEGECRLRITRTFGNSLITLKELKIEPIGLPGSDGKVVKIAPFVVKEGAVLDLSAHVKEFDRAHIVEPILEPSR
jgi:hypothetical protein